MAGDPYIRGWLRQVRNRARVGGVPGALRGVLVPTLAGLVLTPLVRATFLGFLDGNPSLWGEGAAQVVLRASIVVVGWLSLDVFGALIRGQDREVLAVLPVDAAGVVRADLLRVAVERWWLVPGAALVLSPIALAGAAGLWIAAVVSLCGAFAVGLTASGLVHLLAVRIAEDPRWAPLLDLVRGHNPRPQAAFLYAPGVVLLGVGALLIQASRAVPAVALGDTAGAGWLALPFVAAAVAVAPIPALARAAWFRASGVLSEIDARYATLADPGEALRVYLDWMVRFLPSPMSRWALDDLRHGWRTRRTLVTGAWLAGLLVFAAGWTDQAIGPPRAAVVAVLAVFLVAANGVLLARDEPAFLRAWLPDDGGRPAARWVVLWLWAAPVGGLGAISVALRHGLADGLWLFGVAGVAAATAGALAVLCGRLRERGLSVYAPVAAVLAASFAALVGTA